MCLVEGVLGRELKVSVCVVTYNQERYIRQCLQSIVDQKTDFDFEVLVADDCSTDDTRVIVQEFSDKYPSMVKPIFHDNNIGALKNFAFVHEQASCEYVAHIDGDDYWLPGKLQVQTDCLDLHQEFSIVWHRVNFFDDSGLRFLGKDYDYSMFSNGIVTFEKALQMGTVAVNSSVMYRRKKRKYTKQKFDILDAFVAWDLLASGKGKILDNVLGEYRINSLGAITVSSANYVKTLYAQHAKFFLQAYPERRREIFIFALTNLVVDLKNGRKSAMHFFLLLLRSFSFVGPRDFVKHYRDVRKIRIPKIFSKSEGLQTK